MTVFIADDSALIRDRLVSMLSELPTSIQFIGEAHDAPEATEAIRRLKPDVVILDIQMPGGNGIDVLQSIKQEAPATLVLMLTNFAYPEYRKKCMDAGADFFFDKSTEFDKVSEVLQWLIQQI